MLTVNLNQRTTFFCQAQEMTSSIQFCVSMPQDQLSCKKSVYHFKEANVSISNMIYVPQYRDRYQLERFEDNPGDDKDKPGQKRERKIYFVLILLPLPLHQIVQRSVFWGSRETPINAVILWPAPPPLL